MTGPDQMSASEYRALVAGDRTRTGRKKGGTTKSREAMQQFLEHGGFGPVVSEHLFHPHRKWRMDWFLPDHNVGVEYDGLFGGKDRDQGTTSHGSVAGILRDSEKINEAQAMGIRVFRVNAKSIQDGSAFELLSRVLSGKGDES